MTLDNKDAIMLYIIYDTSKETAKTDTGRGAEKEPDCCPRERRRNGSPGEDCGSGELARKLLRSAGDQTCDRETIETVTRMERGRKLLEQQPTPDPAFLRGGTHG